MSAGRGTVELLLTVDAMQAARSLEAHAQALRDGEAATRAQVTAMQAAEAWLREEADAAREAAHAQAELAAAQQRIQTIAASGSAGSKLALQHRREWEELSKLVQVTGSSNATQQAATAIAARQAAEVANLTKRTGTLTTTTTASTGSMVNLGRQLNDAIVQLSMGASPLQVFTQQGEQLAFALEEAGGAGAVLSRVTSALGPALAAAGPILGGVAIAAAAAGAAYAVFGNAMQDADAAARSAGPSLDSLVTASDSAAEAARKLSGEWADVASKIKGAMRELDTIAGVIGKGAAGAAGEIDKLGSSKANEALLADAKRMVTARQALTEAIRRQSEGDAEAGEKVAGLRKEYEEASKVLKAHKIQYQSLELALWGVGEATDAQTEASKAAKDASKLDADAKRAEERAARDLADALKAANEQYAEAANLLRNESANALEAEMNRYDDLVASIEDAMRITGDYESGMKALDKAGAEHLKTLSDLQKAQDAVTTSVIATNNAQKSTNWGQDAASTMSQYGSTSGLLNTVSNAGPWGALIAGIIDILRNFRQTLADINDLISSVLSTIGDLPRIIVDEIRTLLKTLPEQLGSAIGSFIGELPAVIVEVVRMILSPTFWIKVLTSFIDGLVNGLLKALGFDTRINLTGEVDKINGSGSSATKEGTAAARKGMVQGTARTVGPSSYGGRAPGWASATVAKNNGGVGAAMSTRVRMGARNGEVTFTIQESSYADAHKSLQKRGVI